MGTSVAFRLERARRTLLGLGSVILVACGSSSTSRKIHPGEDAGSDAAVDTGGAPGTGGLQGTGGSTNSGGLQGSGGSTSSGGAGTDGAAGTGGSPASGGTDAGSGGAPPADGGSDASQGGDSGLGTGGAPPVEAGPPPVVGPLYGTNGPFWNDYVKADGTTRFDATDTACDPANDGPTYDACIHAGELRALPVPGYSSCAGLTATDSLGAFDWTCIVKANQAWMVSSALKPTMHLGDLIDFVAGTFRQNAVVVMSGGSAVTASLPAVWWANPVRLEAAGVGSGTFVATHTIVIAPAGSTGRYYVNAEKAGMVVEPGSAVTPGDAQVTGNFLWVEGRFQSQSNVLVGSGNFSVIRGVRSDASAGSGILIQYCKACLATDLEAHTAGSVASSAANVNMNNLTGCRVQRVTSDQSYKTGFAFADITNSVFEDFTDTKPGGVGAAFLRVKGSTFRRFSTTNTGNDGYALTDVGTSTFEDVSAIGVGNRGFFITTAGSGPSARAGSSGNHFHHIQAVGAMQAGIATGSDASGDVFNDVLVADNGRANGGGSSTSAILGILLGGGPGHSLNDVRLYGNGIEVDSLPARVANVIASGTFTGVDVYTTDGGHVLQNVTAVNNSYRNVNAEGSRTAVYSNVLSVNGGIGWLGNGTSLGTFPIQVDNAAVTDSTGAGIDLAMNIDWFQFSGVLKVGANTPDCLVSGGAKGITNSCTMADGSTATVTLGQSGAGTFVGPVTGDVANTSDTAGAAPYSATMDFVHFDNRERAWNLAGTGTFPNSTEQGRCVGAATCAIYDWSLRAADTLALNVVPLPTGDDTLTSVYVSNPAPTNQASCDYNDPGSTFVATPNRCETTFLKHAVEIIDDGIGDDDTLCESNETCLYSPNLGGYQGHGNLVSAGTFTPGALTGITLLKYETNGR